MTRFLDQAKGDGLLSEYLTSEIRKVLLIFPHGLGDVVMFKAPLSSLRNQFPEIRFDIGLSPNLDQSTIIPEAIILGNNYKSIAEREKYDIVYQVHFPMEDIHNDKVTKAEICCLEELGINPVSGHQPIRPKPLVGVHFQITSVPGLANASEKQAQVVWDDIVACGCVPIETHFIHSFHNPINHKFDFVDFHVRTSKPSVERLISLLGACFAFVGVVSGPFHLALSILPSAHVLLLERRLKKGHFTKLDINTASLDDYNHEVKQWLTNLGRNT